MTYLKIVNVLISVVSLTFVVTLAWHAYRARFLPANRALIALVIVFALRTLTRGLPPFGEDTALAVAIFDTLLLVVMVILVIDGRRIVQAFMSQRQAAENVQIEYDLALTTLSTSLPDHLEQGLADIESQARLAAQRPADDASAEVLLEIADRAARMRSGGSTTG